MRNRMQDLDFEQTVAFDSVKDFEFTRKAAQKFRQVVSLDSFEDEDADVIFHYLYKEMELVSVDQTDKRTAKLTCTEYDKCLHRILLCQNDMFIIQYNF